MGPRSGAFGVRRGSGEMTGWRHRGASVGRRRREPDARPRHPIVIVLVLSALALTVGAFPLPARAITPPIHCPAGKVPLRFNGHWSCVPAPPSTTSGTLEALARSLTSPSLLTNAGAKPSALALVKDRQAVLRSFYGSVLLRAWAARSPQLGQPKKVVTFHFPGGKFHGFPVRASETLRPPQPGSFGSPRATTLAIAFRGGLPSSAGTAHARTSAPEWVKVSDATAVKAEQCPNPDGLLRIETKGADVVTFNARRHVSQVTATIDMTTLVHVGDDANLDYPIENRWHIAFAPDTGYLTDGVAWHSQDGVVASSMTATHNGVPVGPNETLPTVIDLDPLVNRLYQALNNALARAETTWQSGKCLDASFSPSGPDPLSPNQQLVEKVTIRRRDDQNPVSRAKLTPTIAPGGTVAPAERITDSSGTTTFTITAPSTVMNPLIFHIKGVSRQGVVKGDLPICMVSGGAPGPQRASGRSDTCQQPQPYFRIVSWSSSETASGSEDSSICESFLVNDQARGTSDRSTTLPTPEQSASSGNTLLDRGGHIWSNAVTWTDSNSTTHNCKSDPDTGEEVPCDYSAQDTTGTLTDGVGLEAPSGGNVMVDWPSIGAIIGSVGDPCHVLFTGSLSFEEKRTSVPVATFQAPGEHTISFSGSRHFTQDDNGNPASFDYSWTFTLTFETVFTPG